MPRSNHKWPTCMTTGKRRLGERKDVKLELQAARITRARATAAGASTSWTVVRGYRCPDCNGWHLTSQPSTRESA
jgi:hypothetical protein